MKRRSTPAGEHRPVLLDEVLRILAPRPGQLVVDCTLGFGGHAAELLQRIGPNGLLIGLDLDREHLPRVEEKLQAIGHPFELHHANFASVDRVLGERRADLLLADLGMSSMQVDDPQRGFSYAREGTLDMRMDRSRGKTLADFLAQIDEADLARCLAEYGDEPEATRVARAIVAAREQRKIETTKELARIIQEATGQTGAWRLHPRPGKWTSHPAARSFQALRIALNRELANLTQLLRVLPDCLKPGGRAAIISFHSGEDRIVKKAFQEAVRAGRLQSAADDCVRASPEERITNPRSRSAKLRWAVRGVAL